MLFIMAGEVIDDFVMLNKILCIDITTNLVFMFLMPL